MKSDPPRRSRTLDAMLAEDDAAAAAAAAAAEVRAEEMALALAAVGAGPPPAVFGKRKHSEVKHSAAAGEGARRSESKGGASEGGAVEGAAGGGAASGAANSRPVKQPKLRGTALVNRRVRVWWGGDRKWFAGVVTSYSSRRGHQVQWNDELALTLAFTLALALAFTTTRTFTFTLTLCVTPDFQNDRCSTTMVTSRRTGWIEAPRCSGSSKTEDSRRGRVGGEDRAGLLHQPSRSAVQTVGLVGQGGVKGRGL